MMAFNPRTQEAETGGQSGLHRYLISKNKYQKKGKKPRKAKENGQNGRKLPGPCATGVEDKDCFKAQRSSPLTAANLQLA